MKNASIILTEYDQIQDTKAAEHYANNHTSMPPKHVYNSSLKNSTNSRLYPSILQKQESPIKTKHFYLWYQRL